MKQIMGSTMSDVFRDRECDIIVEAAVEVMGIKKKGIIQDLEVKASASSTRRRSRSPRCRRWRSIRRRSAACTSSTR